MLERTSRRYLLLLYISDILITLLALLLANWARFYLPFGKEPTPFGLFPIPVYFMVALIWSVVFWVLSAYEPERILNTVQETQQLIMAITTALLILTGVLFFSYRGISRLLLGYFYLFDLLLVVLSRTAWRVIFKARQPNPDAQTRVLIVGAGFVGQELAHKLAERSWLGMSIAGFLDDDPDKQTKLYCGKPVLGDLSQIAQIVKQQAINEVILALPLRAYEQMRTLVSELQELPVNIKVVPDFFALTLFAASMEELDGIPLIGLREPAINGTTRLIKRVMDILLGIMGLMLSAPLLLVIPILIKLDSKGPVFFQQARVGEGGKGFEMIKFRTMYVGADLEQDKLVREDNGKLVFDKRRDDPRITKVGKLLRRLSMDELPQLINVIKGDMSLVGPRPELPFLVKMYEPWQWRRFSVPQGMTGWWQVHDRSDSPMHLHTEDDLYYIQNYSLLLDIKILWYTVGAVLKGRGAY